MFLFISSPILHCIFCLFSLRSKLRFNSLLQCNRAQGHLHLPFVRFLDTSMRICKKMSAHPHILEQRALLRKQARPGKKMRLAADQNDVMGVFPLC